MGTARFALWGFLIVVFQASALETAEEPTCVPGFPSDTLTFRVFRKHLHRGTRLGKVGFTDCTDRKIFLFSSDSSHFRVQPDGTLTVRKPSDIHQEREFSIHAWDSRRRKVSVPVKVLLHHGPHQQNAEHHQGDGKQQNPQHHHAEVDSANNTEVPILYFPKRSGGLRRRKRDWVIPDINVPENDRGPYPLKVSTIRSNEDKVKKIYYSITGPAADEPPLGIFTMDRDSGILYLTQPLDRERQDKYMFFAHAVTDGAGTAEEPMEFIVKVIDLNDNKPVFEQDTFQGEVADVSKTGFEVLTVVATDLDQPDTDNSDIKYRIVSQDPVLPSNSLFAINPVSGVIRVNAGGLDREKYPKYTLIVQAADLVGEGLIASATVVLTVTDSNDNAPVFSQRTYEATVAENKTDAQILTMSVTDNDDAHSPAWNAKFRIIEGDPGGLFTVKTGTNKHEGILSTAKGLDFEKSAQHTLLVAVENEVPFAYPLPTSTATIVVTVQDVNEAPIFDPKEELVSKREDLAVDSDVVQYTASDPDTARKVMYRIIQDRAGWLTKYSFFSSDSSHFRVQPDGTLTVRKLSDIHQEREFSIHAWDSRRPKVSVPVKVLPHHGPHQQNAEHHQGDGKQQNPQHHHAEVDSANNTEVPILYFPKRSGGLRRRKRDWVIPDINVPENDRGPYPLKVSTIRSNEDKVKKIYYSITGPGADEPPLGIFTMDRDSGILYLTQPLDRERQDKYMFFAHAVSDGAGTAEEPMEIILKVIDQNDNKPVFEQDTFQGEVAEASKTGFEVLTVLATDLDQPNTDNSDIKYRIVSQDPVLPSNSLFAINPVSGVIRVNAGGLDREKYPKYTLIVQAADLVGEGLIASATVVLTVTDSNDNAPVFSQRTYEATVAENKADAQILTMSVTDNDDAHSPAWNAKFRIVEGDPGGLFAVKTGTNKHEGILSTAKGLDFEKSAQHTLLVAVENEVPFATPLPTSTATIVVTVQDVNEAPIFDPKEKLVSKREDLAVDSDVVQYTASDPDTARKQKVMYRIIQDRAGWLNVGKETGLIKVKNQMDRESVFVKDNKYTALIGAYDNDDIPATGTGTLIIQLEDVNDNAPIIQDRDIRVCNKETAPQLLSVTDKDGPGFAAPYSVSLQGMSKNNWTARMNESKTGIILTLSKELTSGLYNVVLSVADNQGMAQASSILATVCDCTGETVQCQERKAAAAELPVILGILGGILLLLMLVLLLLLFTRRRRGEKKEPLLQDDDVRDNIYYYDEEGGGEDDQDYDLSVLHRGLDNRPEVFRNDVAPNFMPAPQYRPRPANPEEIGNFIDDNLKAADNDATAPPYDSLLVFDYEGGGSDAGSLSSLNSSSSGDQDYDCLGEWGPRFKKLADMYGGGDDDML